MDNEINYQLGKILELKHQCLSNNNIDTIKQMRIIHGRTLIDYQTKINEYIKNYQTTDDQQLLQLSMYNSLINVIASHIHECERNKYNTIPKTKKIPLSDKQPTPNNTSSITKSNSTKMPTQFDIYDEFFGTDTENDTSNMYHNNKPSRNYSNPDIQEISIGDILSESDDDMTGTEYNLNINTKPMTGGDNTDTKPTLVLFWGTWCGPSTQFKPVWDSLVKELSIKQPNLQTREIADDNTPEKRTQISKLGVESFPTIILYIGDKHHVFKGERSPDKIKQFISKHI
jgi:thiol-disulfide isomerase/thioredoxin